MYKQPLFYKPRTKPRPKPKRRWVILPILWRSLKRVCTGLGALFLIFIVLGMVSASLLVDRAAPTMPEEMILYYKIDGDIPEGPQPSGLGNAFGPPTLTLQDIQGVLEQAAGDARVKVVLFNIFRSGLSLTQVQELRRSVLDFRENSGKPAYVYSMSYAEAGHGLSTYALATAFDEIWMQPLGSLSMSGLRLEQPYIRELLNQVGIEPQFFEREDYKGVFDFLKSSSMPEEARVSLETLINSIVSSLQKDILTTRPGMGGKQDFDQLMDQGVFLDVEAEALGLIDKLQYGDILLRDLRASLQDNQENSEEKHPPLVKFAHYHRNSQPSLSSFQKGIAAGSGQDLTGDVEQDQIALIYIQGPIMVFSDDESGNTLLGSTPKSADDIATLIMQAGDDEAIDAVVLRVNSPGGSPVASELIRRAVLKVQDQGKPVIVSMGEMAASGGYWVSAAANQIFALPSTLTGSIGVAGGKVSLEGFWDRLGVNWDHVEVGEKAGMYSLNEPFSEEEAERVNAMMDRIYSAFLALVAEGRNMRVEEAREVAQGRAWSGAQAHDRNLVDQLGGLNEALDYTAQQLGFESRQDVAIVRLPKPKTPMEQILELLRQTSGLPVFLQNTAVLNHHMQELAPHLQELEVWTRQKPVMVYQSGARLE